MIQIVPLRMRRPHQPPRAAGRAPTGTVRQPGRRRTTAVLDAMMSVMDRWTPVLGAVHLYARTASGMVSVVTVVTPLLQRSQMKHLEANPCRRHHHRHHLPLGRRRSRSDPRRVDVNNCIAVIVRNR